MAHPEVLPVITGVADTIVRESDRGAVLIAAAVVDDYLARLFRRLAPSSFGKKRLDDLLENRGPLSSTSAKIDVAILTGLMYPPLDTAIHQLRRLRNSVAHGVVAFRLQDHRQELDRMLELGEGVPAYARDMARTILIESFVENVLESDAKRPVDQRLNITREEALRSIETVEGVRRELAEKLIRGELAVGAGIICGMLVWYSENPQRA